MLERLDRLRPAFHNLLRIMAGFLWAPHGAQKLFGFLRDSGETAELFSRTWFAGAIELGGGLLIMVGLFARTAAFIGAGEMAFAFFLAHFPSGFWPLANRGELAALYCFVWLYFFVAGPGDFSLDAWLARRRGRS
jgi:putative oxidoreductase